MSTATDDFNRADATDDLGANWTDCVGAGLSILTNKATGTTNNYRASLMTATAQTADQAAQAVITGVGAAGSYPAILLRAAGADGTLDCYTISIGGTNEYYISRTDNGADTQLASGTTSFANGDILRAEAEGTTIRLKINGSTVNTATDATYSSGYTGLGIYHEGTRVYMDDFQAEDIGGVSTSFIPIRGLHGRDFGTIYSRSGRQ